MGKIRLSDGTVRAWREAKGAINLMELMSPAQPGARRWRQRPAHPSNAAAPAPALASEATPARPASSRAAEAKSSWTLSAPDIAIENFRLELEDRMVAPTAAFVLAPFNLAVRGFTNAPDTPLDLDARIGIDSTADARRNGTTSPESGAVSARVDLKSFNLAALQPYVSTYTQITLLSGVLSTKPQRRTRGERRARHSGRHRHHQAARDRQRSAPGSREVGWAAPRRPALQSGPTNESPANVASSASAAPSAPSASLRINTLVGPRALCAPDHRPRPDAQSHQSPCANARQHAAGRTNCADIERRTESPGGNPGAMQMSIGTVKVSNGSANFADFWIQPNYAVSLQSLNGTIAGLSSDPKSRAKVALEGKVDRYAPAQITGDINLLSAALFTDMKVSFKGVELTSVTPYSGRFAGYAIEKGKLSIDVEYHVESRKLDAKQRFVVDQLQLGERVESPDAVKLPLRLAVALLKDRNGVIDLNLPVTGSLDDPKFRLGPIIWKAFVGLLTKVATAPFALLGSLFGGGEEINRIDFAPGTATLDATAQERLASIAKALKERPQLQLDVPMSYSPEADGSVLTAQKLNEKLTTLASEQAPSGKQSRKQSGTDDNLDTVLADPTRKFDLLLAQYQVDFGKEATPPTATAAVLAIPKKKREPTSFDAANDELTQAITTKQAVTERDLEAARTGPCARHSGRPARRWGARPGARVHPWRHRDETGRRKSATRVEPEVRPLIPAAACTGRQRSLRRAATAKILAHRQVAGRPRDALSLDCKMGITRRMPIFSSAFGQQAVAPAADDSRLDVQTDALIRAPDGATLSAAIVRSKATQLGVPTLLTIDIYTDPTTTVTRCRTAVARGYACVIADSRGKRPEPRPVVPYEHAAEDGRAVVEWIARQPVERWSRRHARRAVTAASRRGPPPNENPPP